MTAKHNRQLAKLAAAYSRHVIRTRRHLRLVCDRGERPFVVASCSPSDPRSLANLEADLKRNDAPKDPRHD